MKRRLLIIAIALVLGAWRFSLIAQERPKEHPTGKEHPAGEKKEHPAGEKKEHPAGEKKEHPKKAAADEKNFQASYEKFVKDYIASEAGKTGGVYTIKDDVANKDLKLQLIRVHKNKIAMLNGGKTCFACADFKEVGTNKKYDLDFYANKSEDGKLAMDKVLIHKEDGKPRFTYDQNNNIVPAKAKS